VIDEMLNSSSHKTPLELDSRSRAEYTRLLGLANHLLGYDYWINQHDLQQGIQYSHWALKYYRAIQDQEGIATVLDNLARMYALKHDQAQARTDHHQSLLIRVAQRQGNQYRLALGLISGAEINIIFGCFDKAEFQLNQARLRCEKEGRQRGLGLIYSAYGRLYRQIAAQSGLSEEERFNSLRQALTFLRKAENIFKQEVEEPVRLIEVINELGCVYRDWAAIRRPGGSVVVKECQDSSLANFKEARRLASIHHPGWYDRIPAEIPASWAYAS
ncbi:MAG: hypothetical protein IH586_24125, partial [Anaerolineaceae bacterium]|nr:hypothetical protein [Anaerolineaceae bacterium]